MALLSWRVRSIFCVQRPELQAVQQHGQFVGIFQIADLHLPPVIYDVDLVVAHYSKLLIHGRGLIGERELARTDLASLLFPGKNGPNAGIYRLYASGLARC